jgi:hypothetical protein
MDNNQELLDAIDELINSDGDVSLPGLDLETVAETFVDSKYKDQLSAVADEIERKQLRDKWLDYYKNGEGRQTLQLEIATIKSNFSAATDQLKYVTEAAASSIASNAIPAVITTGAAASVANPAYALIENKTKKNQLLSTLKQVGNFIINLLKAAVSIAYPVPAAVLSLITTLVTTKKTVNAIPV